MIINNFEIELINRGIFLKIDTYKSNMREYLFNDLIKVDNNEEKKILLEITLESTDYKLASIFEPLAKISYLASYLYFIVFKILPYGHGLTLGEKDKIRWTDILFTFFLKNIDLEKGHFNHLDLKNLVEIVNNNVTENKKIKLIYEEKDKNEMLSKNIGKYDFN